MLAVAVTTTGGVAVGALIVLALVAPFLIVRMLEWTDTAGREAPGNEDEFPVEGGEPEWWPEFERRFADHVASSRRRRRLR